MISKRGLFSAGALGVGTVLLATGSAFACNINDFSVDSVAHCNSDTGKADITVTDKDSSGTPADVTIIDLTTKAEVGKGHIDKPTGNGVPVTISVDWQKNHEWAVKIDAPRGNVHDTLKTTVSSNGDDCGKPSDVPTTAAPTETAPATGGDTDTKPTEAPSAAPSEATQVDAANSPSPAEAAPSSTVDSAALAETGGGSNTGMIAGVAAALVAIGGGFLFAQRRRSATRSH